MRTPLLALLLTPLFLTQGCASPPPVNTPLQQLLGTVEQRLDIAEAVALSKWDSGQPVQATEREQHVIAGAQTQAARFGVHSQRAATFFADQIEANKLLQYSALSRWQAAGRAPATPRIDLAKQLRPQLDRLQQSLLSNLAEFDRNRPEPCQQVLAQVIEQREINPQRTLAMIRATAHLCSPQ